jgi:hypothetical protein
MTGSKLRRKGDLSPCDSEPKFAWVSSYNPGLAQLHEDMTSNSLIRNADFSDVVVHGQVVLGTDFVPAQRFLPVFPHEPVKCPEAI